MITDLSFDDADGNEPSACGALAIDDVSVQGGGEAYTTGFEVYADGWFQDPAGIRRANTGSWRTGAGSARMSTCTAKDF